MLNLLSNLSKQCDTVRTIRKCPLQKYGFFFCLPRKTSYGTKYRGFVKFMLETLQNDKILAVDNFKLDKQLFICSERLATKNARLYPTGRILINLKMF